jgi:hypothetical protein
MSVSTITRKDFNAPKYDSFEFCMQKLERVKFDWEMIQSNKRAKYEGGGHS